MPEYEPPAPVSRAPAVAPRRPAPTPKRSFERAPGPPTGDNKYALQLNQRVAVTNSKLGTLTLSVRWEMAARTNGELASETQHVMGADFDAKGTRALHKMKTSLLAANVELFQDGAIELGGVAVNMKLDAKAFEASGLDDKLELYAAKLALVGEADFSALFEGGPKVVGQIRIEAAVPVQVIEQLYEARKAKRALAAYGEADRRFRDAKQLLRHKEGAVRRLEGRLKDGLSRADTAKLAALRSEVAALKASKTKLQALRNSLGAARDAATKRLGAIAVKLERSAIGKLTSKLLTTALGSALKKLIPFYGWISTAKDLVGLASAIATIDWDHPGGGGVEGGGDPDAPAGGEPEGGKAPAGDPADEAIPDALLDTSDLDVAPSHELKPVAEQVLAVIRKQSGDVGGAQALDPDAIETINDIVPDDLDAAELEQVRALVQASMTRSGEQTSMAESVIAAMQTVRPDGVKVAAAKPPAPAPQPAAQPKQRKRKAKKAKRRRPKAPQKIDVIAYLREHVKRDPATNKLTIAKHLFTLGGAEFRVTAIHETLHLAVDDTDARRAIITVATVSSHGSRDEIVGYGPAYPGQVITVRIAVD